MIICIANKRSTIKKKLFCHDDGGKGMKEDKGLFSLFMEKDTTCSRRLFLKTCGAAVLLAGMPYNLSKVFAADAAKPAHMTLTWSMDPKTTQSIAWMMPDGSADGMMQVVKSTSYQKHGWASATVCKAATEIFSTNTGRLLIQYATVQNLLPGTGYTYRVGDGENWSQTGAFVTETEQDKSFKFLVFGDSQSGLPQNPEYGPWHTTITKAYAANPDAAFFMNVGDLVEVGQDNRHWQKWYEAAQEVLEKIPLMAVPGNHETYDVPEENHSVKPVYFTTQMKLPGNGPEALKGQVYSFDYSNVHFVVLDSQEAEEGALVPDMLQMEAKWLDEDLAASNKKWKIVLFHKTPYYNKATRANENLKKVLLPVIDKHHVDLVINGHDHGYSRTYPIRQNRFVASPAEGTVYLVAGRSGNKFYTDLSDKIWNAFFHDPQAEPNYVVIEAAGDQLKIQGVSQSGKLLDIYMIDKAKGQDLPKTILPERSNDTRLVIWGNMLQTPLLRTIPQKYGSVWYVPLQGFIEFVGGTFEENDGRAVVSWQKKNIMVTVGEQQAENNGEPVALQYEVRNSHDTLMLAADDVKSIWGFDYAYDESLNMLFLAK